MKTAMLPLALRLCQPLRYIRVKYICTNCRAVRVRTHDLNTETPAKIKWCLKCKWHMHAVSAKPVFPKKP